MQRGLDSREAAARLERDGPNELPTDARRAWLGTLIDLVREPMIALLVGAGVLYVILGDLAEALALMCATGGMIGLSLWQARRTQNAVDRLRDMTAPTARVVRGGETRTLPTRELVAGDVVFVEEGDRVPADGWLVAGTNVSADESLLTGESVPVTKLARDDAADGVAGALPPPGGDGQSAVFAGTLVTQGRGEAVVAATGPRSAMGRIGRALAETKTPPSGIEVEIGRLVKVIALVGAGLCVVLLLARGLGTGDWIGGLLGGLTLAMAILPEEMPVVLMVFTTLGAFRIARLNVLARRPAGIQKLGMATVVCVDKTGTITENAMRVARLEDASGQAVDIPKGAPAAGAADRPDAPGAEPAFELAETFHEVLELAILGSA
ncbi:MAG: cation-transporting P-type ATPase [Myxococcota bacterium]